MAVKKTQQPQNGASDTPDNTQQPQNGATVAMVRGAEFGEPTSADVHPDEVANYQNAGWKRA